MRVNWWRPGGRHYPQRVSAMINRAGPREAGNRPADPASFDGAAGTVRLGRKTKDLVKQLRPGDIAVIRHRNIDRIAAEDLVASGVRVVLNNEPSSDDKYPNRGPLIMVEAGIRLIDFPDADLFEALVGDMLQVGTQFIDLPTG